MVLWATILILQGASLVGSTTGIPGVPENITVMFLNPTSVRVSWSTNQIEQAEKYDVTYKPTDARVVAVVAGNSEAVTLSNLRADTQYQLVVTAVKDGKKLRSRPIVFRTLEPSKLFSQQDSSVSEVPLPPPPSSSAQQPQTYIQIRGVEVGIVVLVLIVWVGAIALFFNRWGKIRMLLPYQPDYKEQLKVPGTGVCNSTNAAYTHNSSQHACSQQLHWSNYHMGSIDSCGGGVNWPKTNRPRVNSAIDVASFLSQEFLRRHGSTSRLCRKVRSADNLPLVLSNQQNSDVSDCISTNGDREIFLKSNQDDSEKSDDTETQQNAQDKTKNDSSLYEFSSTQHQSSRDLALVSVCESTTSSEVTAPIIRSCLSSSQSTLAARRLTGWRNVAVSGRNYIQCPIRQPASVEERCYRQSRGLSDQLSCCLLPISNRYPHLLLHHHQHHESTSNIYHSKICEYGHCTIECNIEIQQHFGLPILSISEPSPSEEADCTNDYL